MGRILAALATRVSCQEQNVERANRFDRQHKGRLPSRVAYDTLTK